MPDRQLNCQPPAKQLLIPILFLMMQILLWQQSPVSAETEIVHLPGNPLTSFIGGADDGDLTGLALHVSELTAASGPVLLIGSPYAIDPVNNRRNGRVDLLQKMHLPRPTETLILPKTENQGQTTIWGPNDDGRFGHTIVTGSFFNQNSKAIAIAAPYMTHPLDGGNQCGMVYLFSATDVEMATQIQSVSATTVIYGLESLDQTGLSMAAGDLSGNGFDDLIISAPAGDLPDRQNCGRVYIIEGPIRDATIPLSATAQILPSSGHVRVINGRRKDDRLGESLACGPLLDPTGAIDTLCIGADHEDFFEPVGNNQQNQFLNVGAVYLINATDLFSATGTELDDLRKLTIRGYSEMGLLGDNIRIEEDTTGNKLWISAPYAELTRENDPEKDLGVVFRLPTTSLRTAAQSSATAVIEINTAAPFVSGLKGAHESLWGSQIAVAQIPNQATRYYLVAGSRYSSTRTNQWTGFVTFWNDADIRATTPSVLIEGTDYDERLGMQLALFEDYLVISSPNKSHYNKRQNGVVALIALDDFLAMYGNAWPLSTRFPFLYLLDFSRQWKTPGWQPPELLQGIKTIRSSSQ